MFFTVLLESCNTYTFWIVNTGKYLFQFIIFHLIEWYAPYRHWVNTFIGRCLKFRINERVTVKVIRNRKSSDNSPARPADPLPPSSPVHYWMPYHAVPIHSSAHIRRAVFRLRVESGATARNYERIKHDFIFKKTVHFSHVSLARHSSQHVFGFHVFLADGRQQLAWPGRNYFYAWKLRRRGKLYWGTSNPICILSTCL